MRHGHVHVNVSEVYELRERVRTLELAVRLLMDEAGRKLV